MTNYKSVRQEIDFINPDGTAVHIVVTNTNGHYDVEVVKVGVIKR